MIRIKICGVTKLADAELVAETGGDAIGFNFYSRSKRYIEPAAARDIVRELPSSIFKVGVFVNTPSRTIASICQQVGLDGVQLHGDEAASVPAELPRQVAVVRAFRLKGGDLEAAAEHLQQCGRCGRLPDAVLVDAQAPGVYGGTGRTLDWQVLAARKSLPGDLPLILAGGLTPENVKMAVEQVCPWGVDTASGVERSPGVKDPDRVRRFVAAAREALAVVKQHMPHTD